MRLRMGVLGAAVAAFFMVSGAVPAFGVSDALPDLVMVKPSGSQIVLDTTTLPGRTLLRYTATVKNTGVGALEVDASRVDTTSPWVVEQRIYNDAGGSRLVPTSAQVVWGGDGHEHWHIVDFETGELFDQNGSSVGVLAKHGFCFADTKGPHGAARVYTVGGCGSFNQAALTLQMGISAGWSDIYNWDFTGQWIDVTGVPAGRYRLVICANTSLGFIETDTTNDCATAGVRL